MSDQLAIAGPKASDQLASFLGIEKGMMLETLKAQCFKNKRPDEVSDAQLAAFVSTANVLQVNPLVPGMLYAYPERNGGITPILGPDGVFKKLDEFIATGKLSGYECEVKMGADGKPESATATIQRKEGQIPAKYTAYYSEWSVTSNPNWQARPRHMLWVRAIKQAARQVIHGLPMDADEYEISQMHNVTPESETPVVRPEPPARRPRGAKAVQEASGQPVLSPNPAAQTTNPEVVGELVTPPAVPAGTPPTGPGDEANAPKHPAPSEAGAVPAMPKLTLKDGEKFAGVVIVEDPGAFFILREGVQTPSIKALCSGDYKGIVFHKGGGVVGADGKPAVPPRWAKGSKLRVTLSGFLNRVMKDPATKLPYPDGVLQTFVDSAEIVASETSDEMEA